MSVTDSSQRAATLVRELTARLEHAHPGLVGKFRPQDYVAALDASRTYGGYSRVPIVVAAACERIAGEAGTDTLDAYHRLVLSHLIATFDQRRQRLRLPDSILAQYAIEFRRILAQFDTAKRGFHNIGNDLFAKDLALCRGKLLPCGAQLVDVLAGVPRRLALSGGMAQALEVAWFLQARSGGFRPFFQLHLDLRSLGQFTPRGWDRCYLRIAELLELNPGVRGVYGSSWWFDPQVERISPEIGFLRRRPLEAGARAFRVGIDEASVDNATRFSRVRKELYDRGVYLPTNWLMVWPRADLLRWARDHRSLGLEN